MYKQPILLGGNLKNQAGRILSMGRGSLGHPKNK